MISDMLGKQLHDRATRGEEITERERDQLEAWYEAQDSVESIILSSSERVISSPDLQEQVATVMRQLTVVTQTIQTLAQENATLRREIATLQQQVSRQITLQSA